MVFKNSGEMMGFGVRPPLFSEFFNFSCSSLLLYSSANSLLKYAYASQFVAGTYTAAAQYATVHVMNKQRIALFHLDTFDTGTHTCVVCTDILDQCLKLIGNDCGMPVFTCIKVI